MARNKGVVSIIIRAFDRSGAVFMKARKRMLAFGSAAASAALGAAKLTAALGAMASVGLGLVTKTIISATSKVEDLNTRLTVLLGSVEKGNQLLQNMTKFAASVSFEFEEIAESATALAGVAKGGVEEVTELMPIIADLAAASGLSIRDTTGQMIRMMSAGAAAADMFRERGILAMLGFQAGVSYTAEETMTRVRAAFEDTNSKFRGASSELAKNWSGLVSMMADRWFFLRTQIGEAGIFDSMSTMISAVIDQIDAWIQSGQLQSFAETFSSALQTIFLGIGISVSKTIGVVQKGAVIMTGWILRMKGYWPAFVASVNESLAWILDGFAGFVNRIAELGAGLPGPLGTMFSAVGAVGGALQAEAARMREVAFEAQKQAQAVFSVINEAVDEGMDEIRAKQVEFINLWGSFFDPAQNATRGKEAAGGGGGGFADAALDARLAGLGLLTPDEIQGFASEIDMMMETWLQKTKDLEAANKALARMLQDIAVNAIGDFADAWAGAWEAAISGAEGFGKALIQGLLGALSTVAKAFGEFFLAQAIAAMGMGLAGFAPQGFAAVAQFTAAAAAMFSLSGILSGIAGGGGGGGGGPEERDVLEEAGRGRTSIIRCGP